MFSFEVRDRDILARIGRLQTGSGVAETPLFLPVINPAKQAVPAKDMRELFGCSALITNAYILKRQFGSGGAEKNVHDILDFHGTIMTDSGAYQILAYGQVETTATEIIRYQEAIGTDIATILDIPTGWKVSKEYATFTVEETLKRARELGELKRRKETAWVGPVQGGSYLDLVAFSAKEMGKLPFQIHALGSPTPVMEQYMFDLLVDMIMTAKMNLPPGRPLHLFGAGHPFMFSLAVALGCDLFDSAAYSIYARADRYMTEYGTIRFDELDYLPCSCPVCAKSDPEEFSEMPRVEREGALTKHNLYVCFSEIRRIKQAIYEGRLWEYLEMKAHGHPSLLQALKRLGTYSSYLEENSPISKRSGIFFFSSAGLSRPEITRYQKRLFERYSKPKEAKMLVLLPRLKKEPYPKRGSYRKLIRQINKRLGELRDVHFCTYSVPFGIIPPEIEEIYPLSQYEVTLPPDVETVDYVADIVAKYIGRTNYEIVALWSAGTWEDKVAEACVQACSEKGICCRTVELKKGLEKELSEILRELRE